MQTLAPPAPEIAHSPGGGPAANGLQPAADGHTPQRLPDGVERTDIAKVWVEPWGDVFTDGGGHHPRSPYVEYFWLGVLGPSATWLVRRLSLRLEEQPSGFTMNTREMTRELGLGGRQALQAAFDKAFDRCCRFGLMQRGRHSTLFVRTRLPDLTPRMTERLPENLRAAHDTWRQQRNGHTPEIAAEADLQTRARHLAMALLAAGDSPEETERQLHSWQFHPAVAFEAARWATEQHTRAQAAVVGLGVGGGAAEGA